MRVPAEAAVHRQSTGACRGVALAYLGAVAEGLFRGNETHLAAWLLCHKNHSLGLYAANLSWLQVCQDANLPAYHLLRCIILGYSGDYDALIYTCIYC